ncbi:SpoIID/LytB domain-containing protein [Nocardioides acrostichi]|uniref:SpoIID/LytB domain-containing protein n=1 Tax=Nocardioides acrostichi TaxID=2784339 RepID=A0A930Y604_9ACTN|nr:SpoIID/LytB domain-containing protein [Nocardioides acrostichi]MBF4161810.1 SpoIID/LytB domain-containing protein [Nocardioides acrostichi]
MSRRLPFLLIAPVLGLVLSFVAVATAPSAQARAGGVTLQGKGFGHGKGLSQYGAKARAEAGWGYQRILGFYYPGTKQGSVGGQVTVLISGDTGRDVRVVDRSGLKVKLLGKSRTIDLTGLDSQAKQWRLRPDAQGRTHLESKRTSGGWHSKRRFAPDAEFRAPGPITLIKPGGRTTYRGTLRSVSSNSAGTRRDTVNKVSLESYLRGVVPQEVPALWSANAVRAQAVAARTYAAYERAHPLTGRYQICDTALCQVYGGASAEHPASDQAVKATRKQVRTYQGRPAFTQFSASNGGYSVKGSAAYLKARKDTFDDYPVWKQSVSAAAIESAYDIGAFRSLSVSERDGNGAYGGRAVTVSIRGSSKTVTVSGDAFRSTFGLRSTLFKTT